MNNKIATLFEETIENMIPNLAEFGTFKDSRKAPVHGWFTYPAGFSFKAVEHSIQFADLVKGQSLIYDPFMGSGTTNIVAKSLGYNSVGVEAHPFVYRITATKLNWDVKYEDVEKALSGIEKALKRKAPPKNFKKILEAEFPELIIKCFLPETLYELLLIRDALKEFESNLGLFEFLRTGMVCTLRDVSIAATGWPYIAPNKIKVTSMSKLGWDTYKKRVLKMYGDIVQISRTAWKGKTAHDIILGDSRDTEKKILSESVDHIFTSPPYLNNFDYADRTRLEMYFMGDAKNWGDISDQIRTKLITSATTQISRSDERYEFSAKFIKTCPEVYHFLNESVNQLAELRKIKGGKKSYDLLTVGYFNDLFEILSENFRVLKDGKKAMYILGDSAPYGIHIPTDELIGKIGVCIGFKNYKVQILRERGGKWANNPQRHSVALRESVVTLYK